MSDGVQQLWRVNLTQVCIQICRSLIALIWLLIGVSPREPAAAAEMSKESAIELVQAHLTVDPYQTAAQEIVALQLKKLTARMAIPTYNLVIVNVPPALQEEFGTFYTAACSAVPLTLDSRPLIVCNEDYLYEIEAAMRANEMASVYGTPPIKTDPTMYSLVRQLTPHPKEYALSLRSKAQNHSDPRIVTNEEHIREHLELALLFFVGHELGHLHLQHPQSSLVTIFTASTPLVDNVETAVLRMCRHAEEFWKEGNSLDQYEWVESLSHEIETNERFSKVRTKYRNAKNWYQQEVDADSFATRVMNEYLEMQPSTYRTAKKQFFVIETLHAIGVYALYRDLTMLADRICPKSVQRTEQFLTCLAWDRRQYVKVSSVFSDVHRPVLLRTKSVMYDLFESREDQSGLLPQERKWVVGEKEAEKMLASGESQKLEYRMMYAQNWQRYILHDILSDAAVKLTNHACATGWKMEIDGDEEDAPFFFMQFFGIEDAIQRMQKLVAAKNPH